MEDFQKFLKSKKIIPAKKLSYYCNWVEKYLSISGKEYADPVIWDDVKAYLKRLETKYEDWQVSQAEESLKYYQYFLTIHNDNIADKSLSVDKAWKLLADEMVQLIRLKHLSISTEKTYLMWLRRFYLFLEGKPLVKLSGQDISHFLSHLAVERKIAASTQNQAFNALLFFFRHVLGKEEEITQIQDTVRARRKTRLPVVLSKQEVLSIFTHLEGPFLLMSRLIYGSGLRITECL